MTQHARASSQPPEAAAADALLDAQYEDREWLAQLETEGKLAKYRGEYVIAAEKQILGHSRNLGKVHSQGLKKARAKGIPTERLVLHFVLGHK